MIDDAKHLILICGPTELGVPLGDVILETTNSNRVVLTNESDSIESVNTCLLHCATLMQNDVRRIVVANQFTTEDSLIPYREMSERYKYQVHTVTVS